tara:strand:- start:2052 stop:2183 length:132 start_codon:yes stop_codon:yes gene_type:complete
MGRKLTFLSDFNWEKSKIEIFGKNFPQHDDSGSDDFGEQFVFA